MFQNDSRKNMYRHTTGDYGNGCIKRDIVESLTPKSFSAYFAASSLKHSYCLKQLKTVDVFVFYRHGLLFLVH